MINEITVPVISLPNVVFFPETVLPMTIQDRTCIKIIKDAVKNNTLVALAKSKEDSTDLSYRPSNQPNLVCTTGTPHIIEENEEAGFIRIVLKGEARIALKNCVQELPYPIFKAEVLIPNVTETIFEGDEIFYLQDLMRSWLETYILDSREREQFLMHLNSVYRLVNNVSMLLVKDPKVKQILLENDSLPERIKLLNKLFRSQTDFQENSMVANAMINFDNLEFRNLMPN
jgi:ATP-dependent Lon protease